MKVSALRTRISELEAEREVLIKHLKVQVAVSGKCCYTNASSYKETAEFVKKYDDRRDEDKRDVHIGGDFW